MTRLALIVFTAAVCLVGYSAPALAQECFGLSCGACIGTSGCVFCIDETNPDGVCRRGAISFPGGPLQCPASPTGPAPAQCTDVEMCCDPGDFDDDGIPDAGDNCRFVFNPDQRNDDADQRGNVCDACPGDAFDDGDGDGICGDIDNCPVVANANQLDSDGDGAGDTCDADDDNDSVPDADDNCPLNANLDQGDTDGDGAGNLCDTDDDNDGVQDAADECLQTAAAAIVNPAGCSVADLCPCANDWKNHGAYVSCVSRTAGDFVAAGLLTAAQKDAEVEAAAESACGKKE